MALRGFILDFDGTLVDSMVLWSSLGETYLAGKNVGDIPPGLSRRLQDMSLRQAADYLHANFLPRLSPERITDEINAMVADAYRLRVPLKEGVRGFLDANSGTPMCIATETDKPLVLAALERLGLAGRFAFILTSAEVGGSKRSPRIFLQAAQKMGLDPGELAVFDDAPHALLAAKEAGFYTVGVYDDAFRGEWEQIRGATDCYVCHLNEFEEERHEKGIDHRGL